MDKLYPIVRRVRRPLLPDDALQPKQPDAPAALEPKQADATAVEHPQQAHAEAPEN